MTRRAFLTAPDSTSGLAARLASMPPFSESAIAGGLLSYSAGPTEIARRRAFSVDRILRGTKPGDNPVEEPSKFGLALAIPPAPLPRAAEVIEA